MKAGAAAGFLLVALWLSKAAAFDAARIDLPSEVTPVVVFGADQRATAEDFALQHHLDAPALRKRYAATGIVHCGNAHGAGQLTLADDVLTTAAHVLYDRNGRLRGDREHCRFVVEADGQEVSTALEVEGAVVGSTNPYNESAVHDWAVVRLARPLAGAVPYPLGRPANDEAVRLVARGSIDWREGRDLSLQDCRLRAGLEDGAEGTREFSFDCSANIGASGAGLLDAGDKGLLAIFVGWRSIDADRPLPFSSLHYNFAVTIEGAFRRAVERAAALRTAGR